MTKELARLLRRHGLQQVQTHPYRLEYRADTSEGQHFAEDVRLMFQTLMPFLRKWARVPNNYEEICQQAVREMQQPDFVATWILLTAWGISQQGKCEPLILFPEFSGLY